MYINVQIVTKDLYYIKLYFFLLQINWLNTIIYPLSISQCSKNHNKILTVPHLTIDKKAEYWKVPLVWRQEKSLMCGNAIFL